MTTGAATVKPLWLLIEEKMLELESQDLAGDNRERTIQRVAKELDNKGHNVSGHGGNMLQLRWAIDTMVEVGRPLMKDFNETIAALKLEDVSDASAAAMKIIRNVGETWPKLKASERRPDIFKIIEKTRLELLTTRAKGLPTNEGVRFLIEEEVTPQVITEALGITEEVFGKINAALEEERALRAGVEVLLEEVEDKSDEEKVKHLINKNVSDELIIEMAGVDQATLDGVKKAMEAEIEEKKRLEEEAAALKKAEAAGPALADIPPDQMLEYIESIREILEFSEEADEIRAMCEQSSIPKCLVDIAASEPDRLDQLEQEAEAKS